MDPFYTFPRDKVRYQQSWSSWKDGFTNEELAKIILLGHTRNIVKGAVGGGSTTVIDTIVRNSSISWISPTPETNWLFERLTGIADELNKLHYGFDISGIGFFQYTMYAASPDGNPQHYGWHIDRMGVDSGNNSPRKLSLILQLSDPSEYEGGEVQVHGLDKATLPKDYGYVCAFPGYMLHRVTPVTAGVRRSLVAWFVGPDFR
jgi:PKHD-type hydroxylase